MKAYSVQSRSLDVWRAGYLSNAPANFSQLGLVYLSNSDKVSKEMKDLRKYSSIMIGVSSISFFPKIL